MTTEFKEFMWDIDHPHTLYTKINWKSVTHTQSNDKTLRRTGTGLKDYYVCGAMTFHFSQMTFYHNNSYNLLPLWSPTWQTANKEFFMSLQFSGMHYFLSQRAGIILNHKINHCVKTSDISVAILVSVSAWCCRNRWQPTWYNRYCHTIDQTTWNERNLDIFQD